MGHRKMKKIFFKFLILILITNTAYSNQSSTSLTVTVRVIENYEKGKIINANYLIDDNKISLPNNEPIIITLEKDKITTTHIIRQLDYDCCYCTQKLSDGSYIDEEKNSYLMDKKTNKFVINHLNEKTNKVIFCPKINIKK